MLKFNIAFQICQHLKGNSFFKPTFLGIHVKFLGCDMYLKNSSFDEASVMSRVCLADHKIDQKFKPKVQKMSRLEQDEP